MSTLATPHSHLPVDWIQDAEGRRRMAQGYGFTNDTPEWNRQLLEHRIMRLVWRNHFSSPVTKPKRILDVACGSGVWGLEVTGTAFFPVAEEIVCLDIDGVLFKKTTDQLEKLGVPLPAKIRFAHVDAREALPFGKAHFDFTHARFPEFLSDEQWPWFIRELARVTQPEGWVEIDTYGVYCTGLKARGEESVAATTLLEAGIHLAHLHGVTLGGLRFSEYLLQAGVSQQAKTKIAGRKGGAIQQDLVLRNVLHMTRQLKPSFAQRQLLSENECDVLIAQLETEARGYGFYFPYLRVWFQPKDITPPVLNA